jgi:hypothetical protein
VLHIVDFGNGFSPSRPQGLLESRTAKLRFFRRYYRNPPAAPLSSDEANLDADAVDLDDSSIALGVPIDGLACVLIAIIAVAIPLGAS